MNNQFARILGKKECSEYEYISNKVLFDDAVKSGLISEPERYEKSTITDGARVEIKYGYRWQILDL